MERRAAVHTPQTEQLQRHAFTARVGIRFIPVHLCYAASLILLADVGLGAFQFALLFPISNRTPHAAWAHFVLRHLTAQPLINALGGVSLFARGLLIRRQNLMDKQHHFSDQPGRFPLPLFAFGWDCFVDGFLTIRRCAPSFLATPKIVPTPSKYSRRIFSNNSTLALQSNRPAPSGQSKPAKTKLSGCVLMVGQIPWPKWAKFAGQTHGPDRIRKGRRVSRLLIQIGAIRC